MPGRALMTRLACPDRAYPGSAIPYQHLSTLRFPGNPTAVLEFAENAPCPLAADYEARLRTLYIEGAGSVY